MSSLHGYTQLCHYSVISQSHVYILEFYLGEPQLVLTCIQRVLLYLLRSSVAHTPLEHWHLLVLSAHSNTGKVLPPVCRHRLTRWNWVHILLPLQLRTSSNAGSNFKGKLVTSSAASTRAETTTCVNTNTSVRNVVEITPRTNTTHRSSEEGLQAKYWRYNLLGADNQKPMTTAEWSKTAIPLPRPPNSELENTIANNTITSHTHLFNIKTPINIDIFQSLLSHHPNHPFIDSVLAGACGRAFGPRPIRSPRTFLLHILRSEVHFRNQPQHEQERSHYSLVLWGLFCLFLERPPVYIYPRTSKDRTGPLKTGLLNIFASLESFE